MVVIILLVSMILVQFCNAHNAVHSKFNWTRNNDYGFQYDEHCQFSGTSMIERKDFVSGDDCGSLCRNTTGCTHFVWVTSSKCGTCITKEGDVTVNDAEYNFGYSVCGVLDPVCGPLDTPNSKQSCFTPHQVETPAKDSVKECESVFNETEDALQEAGNEWNNAVCLSTYKNECFEEMFGFWVGFARKLKKQKYPKHAGLEKSCKVEEKECEPRINKIMDNLKASNDTTVWTFLYNLCQMESLPEKCEKDLLGLIVGYSDRIMNEALLNDVNKEEPEDTSEDESGSGSGERRLHDATSKCPLGGAAIPPVDNNAVMMGVKRH